MIPKWKYFIAKALRVCGNRTWVQESQRTVWHKMHTNIVGRTQCGWIIENPELIPFSRSTVPDEEEQCVICQFDLRHLHMVEFRHEPPPPQEPKCHA